MGKILIVEDNRDIGMLYTRALFSHQHTLKTSAEAAMKELETNTFDLIILDMHLPEASGLIFLEHVRRQLSDSQTPVFVISADDLLRTKCEELGIQAWMTKPIELDELMVKAAQLIEQYAKTQKEDQPLDSKE
jgi:DNA-binding response OmpR family regulator